MSVEITHAVWMRGMATVALYGPITACGESEFDAAEDLLWQLLDELEAKAESLGATHVLNLLVDVTIGEKVPAWALTGCAVKLERAGWL